MRKIDWTWLLDSSSHVWSGSLYPANADLTVTGLPGDDNNAAATKHTFTRRHFPTKMHRECSDVPIPGATMLVTLSLSAANLPAQSTLHLLHWQHLGRIWTLNKNMSVGNGIGWQKWSCRWFVSPKVSKTEHFLCRTKALHIKEEKVSQPKVMVMMMPWVNVCSNGRLSRKALAASDWSQITSYCKLNLLGGHRPSTLSRFLATWQSNWSLRNTLVSGLLKPTRPSSNLLAVWFVFFLLNKSERKKPNKNTYILDLFQFQKTLCF